MLLRTDSLRCAADPSFRAGADVKREPLGGRSS
ncbi:Mycobacterium numidiamassiliense ORFan [Mycobacterium numidiamassiliense]|uniref:Mycobacterium numidiamassiliense ORFan n=1 Tax=Mycobacterium numidiamassiliense TaxID=1841861 RepID=A0A2U3PEX9_9MYCO|nr:Mycobacterium numidiamassiliense ORFan [Mycobacterium numidiamassiliense]